MAVVGGKPSTSDRALSTRMDQATLLMHFDQIENRIDRLEKTVAAAVDLLHRLLHPDKTGKPGVSGGRE
jgi:hypothetical protein